MDGFNGLGLATRRGNPIFVNPAQPEVALAESLGEVLDLADSWPGGAAKSIGRHVLVAL
jgi:hypothetical protein